MNLTDSLNNHYPASVLDRLDPRLRLLAALLLITVIILLQSRPALATVLGGAIALAVAARPPLTVTLTRIIPLNVMLALFFPFIALAHVQGLQFGVSAKGLHLFIDIVLRANALLITALALVGSLDIPVLGHALVHLRVPRRLAHLLLFTIRYLEVMHREFMALSRAARVRNFHPGANRHSYRTLAAMVGQLLLRSLDRAERILKAMKCRGYNGQFHLLRHFSFRACDAVFALCFVPGCVLLIVFDRML